MLLPLRIRTRHVIGRSWLLTRWYYWWFDIPFQGQPDDPIWYFAFGSNMHHSAFLKRRKMKPREWRVGRLLDYRLRFNLQGRPIGRAAPANIEPAQNSVVWGVLYLIDRKQLIWLDATEGVGRGRYRPHWLTAKDTNDVPIDCVTYIAKGLESDLRPSLRYITLLREGARDHGLPEEWIAFLESVQAAD